MSICPRCGHERGEDYGESGIYSPGREFRLCMPCWDEESAEIDAAGTNDLPERLEQYRQMARYGRAR